MQEISIESALSMWGYASLEQYVIKRFIHNGELLGDRLREWELYYGILGRLAQEEFYLDYRGRLHLESCLHEAIRALSEGGFAEVWGKPYRLMPSGKGKKTVYHARLIE